MSNITESLAGGVAILYLYGFGYREINNIEEDIFLTDINILKKKISTEKLSTINLYERKIKRNYY